MARRPARPPHDDDDLDEEPSVEDIERFSGVTRTCPQCGTELYDDAEVCWKCGHLLSAKAGGPPRWVIIVAAVIIVLVVVGYIRFSW